MEKLEINPIPNVITSTITPWAILTATAGLIAFHIGLFTLIGRERKSPYIINTVFPILAICLFIAASATVAILLPQEYQEIVLRILRCSSRI